MSGACSTAAYNTGYWSGSEAARDRIWLAQASAAFRAFRSLHVCLCMLFVCRVFVALSRFTRTSTECIRLRRPLSIPHLRRRNWTPRIQPPPHSHRTLCSARAATLGSGPPPVVPVSAAPSRPFPRSPSVRFSSSLRPRAWSPRSSSMCPPHFPVLWLFSTYAVARPSSSFRIPPQSRNACHGALYLFLSYPS